MNEIIHMAQQGFYVLLILVGIWILGGAALRAGKHFWRRPGRAFASVGLGIVLAVILAHEVGIFNWGNEKFKELPGHIGGYSTVSYDRSWQ